jgi:ABC-type sugar transport system permease subunit
MARFIVRRLVQAALTLVGITILTFALIRLAPGDPVTLMLAGTAEASASDVASSTVSEVRIAAVAGVSSLHSSRARSPTREPTRTCAGFAPKKAGAVAISVPCRWPATNASARPWIRWLSILFILPWAVPSIPTILSFRWMLNSEWGMLNNLLWELFGIDGPWWLVNPQLAFGSVIAVHIWKYLPFWTLILLAGRMAIPNDLYEAARIDGATPLQQFTHVTWPQLRNLYVTSVLLSTIWSLGDFNSVYLLTTGGPNEMTHVLATLGIRYAFRMMQLDLGVATVMTALPVLIPLVVILVRRLGGRVER